MLTTFHLNDNSRFSPNGHMDYGNGPFIAFDIKMDLNLP